MTQQWNSKRQKKISRSNATWFEMVGSNRYYLNMYNVCMYAGIDLSCVGLKYRGLGWNKGVYCIKMIQIMNI